MYQQTYNETLWCVRVGIVSVESQQYVSIVFYTYICRCKLTDMEGISIYIYIYIYIYIIAQYITTLYCVITIKYN
jgi:hypothetical protein